MPPACRQGGSEPVAVIAFLREQFDGAGERGKQQKSSLMVAHLAFGKRQDDRSPRPVANGMEIGVQPTFGAPDTSGSAVDQMKIQGSSSCKPPLFNTLAAIRSAWGWVASASRVGWVLSRPNPNPPELKPFEPLLTVLADTANGDRDNRCGLAIGRGTPQVPVGRPGRLDI